MHQWPAEALRCATDERAREEAVRALLAGGDGRLRLDDSGRNKYFCRPVPDRSVVCLSSCTASPIDEAGLAAAAAAYDRIAGATDGARAHRVDEERDRVVAAIGRYLGLDPAVEIILTPSGTDGLLLAAALMAFETGPGPLTAILPSPAETGSGVSQAVACRAFDGPEAGQPLVDRVVDVVSVRHRGADGEALPSGRISQDYEAACRAARGRPLLYLTHGTKTGLVAPVDVSAGVDVVVDACQLRLRSSAVRGYIARGWPVVITGSKFLGGPAFCGAVLLPPGRFSAAVRRRAEAILALGGGAADADPALRATVGPLLRWSAALATPGGRFPSEDRTAALLKRLGEVAADAVGSLPGVRVMQGEGPPSGIVAFAVQKLDHSDVLLTADELRPFYRSLALQGVLLGQPVDLGPFGALRLAVGMRDVLRGSLDFSLRRLTEDWPLARGHGTPRARAA